MKRIFLTISSSAVLAAIGGGLASALLSLVALQQTFLAQILGYISPLPIMLAALAFGSWPGWIAAVIGTSAFFLFTIPMASLAGGGPQWDQMQPAAIEAAVYGVGLALPAWWMSRLAASTRAPASATVTSAVADERKIGLILLSAAAFSVIGIVADILAHGGFGQTIAKLVELVEPYVQTFLDGHDYAKDVSAHEVARAAALTALPMEAGISLLILGFNVWLAARITRASGRFPAPWPDLARSLRMPRLLGLGLAVVLGLAFAGGIPGMIALIAAGTLIMAFAMQGLALIHDVTRGESYRFPLLVLVYMTLAIPVLMPWLLALYSIIGLGDAGLAFRNRPKRPPAPSRS